MACVLKGKRYGLCTKGGGMTCVVKWEGVWPVY